MAFELRLPGSSGGKIEGHRLRHPQAPLSVAFVNLACLLHLQASASAVLQEGA